MLFAKLLTKAIWYIYKHQTVLVLFSLISPGTKRSIDKQTLGNYIPRSSKANLSWVLLAQGKLEECNILLLNSLAGREKALGKNNKESIQTGLILYALSNLCVAQNQWDNSFKYHHGMVNMALNIWSVDPSTHKNKITHTIFLKGKLFKITDRYQKASIAFRVASYLRKEITKED
ncbi:tetratricopeptide repeat domain-containing protein [Penicillium herquei]|nr:tetratricopeptide repeat domain-containing protein [Penicillium herquei]